MDNNEIIESKWITLECRPKNIAIGVFYGPQENEKIEKVKDIYHTLETQINQKIKTNEIILGGDFNAKLEINNEKGKQTISRNGKIMQEVIDNTNLTQSPPPPHTDYGLELIEKTQMRNQS